MDRRHGRARAEGAILFLKDGSDVESHEEQDNSVSASVSVAGALTLVPLYFGSARSWPFSSGWALK
jgi:hypothetical protein